jgi:N-acetylornithine carbamoyltransferase
MKRFVDLADLDPEPVQELVELACRLERKPHPKVLEGKVLALLFLNPSLRTLASFQAGMARLGGSSFVINPGQGSWKLETRAGQVMDGEAAEHLREAVPVLASYADAIGVRAFAGGTDLEEDLRESLFTQIAELCEIPLINMESAMNHPCQALADWKTMDDLDVPAQNGRFVLSWAWHPRPLPLAVPAAALHMAAQRGMQVTLLRPEGFELPAEVMRKAAQAAERSGGEVLETSDRSEALRDAHVLYAKSWGAASCYGDAQAESELRARHREWCVSEEWFGPAEQGCKFMHCLPVRRNVVVADEVLDSPRSVVVRQARTRMWAQMAVLCSLLAPEQELS